MTPDDFTCHCPRHPVAHSHCTNCAGAPSDGFYTGCLFADGHCQNEGFVCNGEGLITMPAVNASDA
jgi:hypothetical protein